jgi:hypothetical protein
MGFHIPTRGRSIGLMGRCDDNTFTMRPVSGTFHANPLGSLLVFVSQRVTLKVDSIGGGTRS